jgi:hypothetical protein
MSDKPSKDWVESKAKRLALDDGQLWSSLAESSREAYRELAKIEWYDYN